MAIAFAFARDGVTPFFTTVPSPAYAIAEIPINRHAKLRHTIRAPRKLRFVLLSKLVMSFPSSNIIRKFKLLLTYPNVMGVGLFGSAVPESESALA
jgi:hypothetical protein